MSHHHKAQITVEFALMVGLAFVFLTVLLVITQAYLEKAQEEKARVGLEAEAHTLQQELLLAASVHDGYKRTLSLPVNLQGHSFSTTLNETVLTLTIGDYTTSRHVPNATGVFTTGENVITKRDGVITITQP